MGLELMIIAAICIAISNLCMRKSIDAGGSSRGYLMLQMSLSFVIMVILNPIRRGDYSWNTSIVLFGLAGGLLLAAVMTFLGKSLEKGPAGLSVAILNCSSVMPILVLVMLFGARFGFHYTLWNALGSLLVIGGICWAGWDKGEVQSRRQWLLFISLTFFAHVAYLTYLNWRVLFMNFPGEEGLGLPISAEQASSPWFMPSVFFSAAVIQTFLYLTKERRIPNGSEISYGVFGSIANGLGAFLMIRATEVATSLEHAMLFPIFSVTLILGCNIWGKMLYKEAVNWKANALCIGGVLLGMVDWQAIFN